MHSVRRIRRTTGRESGREMRVIWWSVKLGVAAGGCGLKMVPMIRKHTQAGTSLSPLLLSAIRLIVCISLQFLAGVQPAGAAPADVNLQWVDAADLCLEGKGWTATKSFYDRLPARAEGVVPPAVWGLAQDSAGMAIRFTTDAKRISARWTVRSKTLAMTHMPASGVSGVDLYIRHRGEWRWLGAARPDDAVTAEKQLASGLGGEPHDFLLYLPLYNGVSKVEIGVPAEAKCAASAPRASSAKPILFYGTSIVQGGCASRPGMAYPAILGRRFDGPTINLGFSGSARCEAEVGQLLAELDPSVYVLDPLPNMSADLVAERLPGVLAAIRQAHPRTPIVLVENVEPGSAAVTGGRRPGWTKSNETLRKIFDERRKAGDRRLFYVPARGLLGEDGQGTVDGVHPTDLGFMRMADGIEPVLKKALRAAR